MGRTAHSHVCVAITFGYDHGLTTIEVDGVTNAMSKMKSHKALLKRVRVTGRGKVKFKRAFTGHLRSHKSGDKLRQLRNKRLAKSGDIPRLAAMLHRPLVAAKQD